MTRLSLLLAWRRLGCRKRPFPGVRWEPADPAELAAGLDEFAERLVRAASEAAR